MSTPTWSDLKRRLEALDRTELLALIRDLHAASNDNQAFLNARFDLGEDVLTPYRATISQWVSPDVLGRQTISVSKAKKAISDYRKAVGQPEGLAELETFYCERCAEYVVLVYMDSESYFNALVRMFAQALGSVHSLPPEQRRPLLKRLETVQFKLAKSGWWVAEQMDDLLEEYGVEID